MKFSHKGNTKYGQGTQIVLNAIEVARAIDVFLLSQEVVVDGPRTIVVREDGNAYMYVDPGGRVIWDGCLMSPEPEPEPEGIFPESFEIDVMRQLLSSAPWGVIELSEWFGAIPDEHQELALQAYQETMKTCFGKKATEENLNCFLVSLHVRLRRAFEAQR